MLTSPEGGAIFLPVQIYLLSVLSTIAAGATIEADYLVERFPVLEPLKRFAASGRSKGMLGIITAAVGFVKLFARVPGQPVIVGDFLPAVAGMLLGAVLIIDRFRERARTPAGDSVAEDAAAVDEGDASDKLLEREGDEASGLLQIGDALKPYRRALGLGGITVGAIHFLLAGTLFL